METTMTVEEHKSRTARSYKLILLFAMVSMTMMFAGLTSAFIVSKSSRTDWDKNFQLPTVFFLSTIAILLCSLTFHLAKKAIQKDNRQKTTIFLLTTLVLGLSFVAFQIEGFHDIYLRKMFPVNSILVSYLWVVVVLHLLHLAGGLIALLIIIYKHFKYKYNATQTLGIELGAMYWHFLDVLWVYLFLFLFFFK